jgi:hypothetical protein
MSRRKTHQTLQVTEDLGGLLLFESIASSVSLGPSAGWKALWIMISPPFTFDNHFRIGYNINVV